MDDAWRALAHGTRRDILRLVTERELSAGEIAATFAITRPAVSQHLTNLKAAGLLDERRDGTKRLYRLRPALLHALRDYLAELSPPAERDPTVGLPSALRRELWLEARPEVAFRLFSDPAQLARWKGELHGSFLLLEAPTRLSLAFGWRADSAGRAKVDLRFSPDGSGTRLQLLHEGPGAAGWDHYLPRLESLARGWDPGPDPGAQLD